MKLVDNLRLWKKFALLGLVTVLIALPLGATLVADRWDAAQVAAKEAQGIGPADSVLRLLRMTQQHRGLSAGFLGGNEAMGATRADKQKAVSEALDKALADAAIYTDQAHVARREAIRSAWSALPGAVAGKSISPAESFQRHTALVAEQMQMLENIIDASGMALDPEAPTYYLMQAVFLNLPRVTEILGQLRARGTVALTRGELSPADRTWVLIRREQLTELSRQFQENYKKAAAADKAVEQAMKPSFDVAEKVTAEALKLIEEQLIKPERPTGNAADYFKSTTVTIDAQFALAEASYEFLQKTLSERASGARLTVLSVALGVALALLFTVWLSWVLTRGALRSVSTAQRAAQALASGDLTQRIAVDSRDEIGAMAKALDAAMVNLSRTLAQVLASMESVASASSQIAQGNADLSTRTEQQASSLQETAANMQHMAQTLATSSDNARQANQLALSASQVAGKGGEVVAQVVATMQEISDSSRRIADIIGVIDGIAFQTNILALNAAVEAARAGEQGRGFAVVASEVRSLAQRSAEAAREIKGLISSSVSRVEAGSQLVGEAGRTMTDIVGQVRRVADLISEITAASQEQNAGIREVNAAMELLDRGTQQNAALVEESTAAAENLRQQASQMAEAASVFRIDTSRS